jgi:hypothetical protein
MNSHNQPDDLIDLSLRHSLKNWAAHKAPHADGRDRLLAAVQEDGSPPKHRPSKFNFGWSFRFVFNQDTLNTRLFYRYTLESIYSLKTNMAIL